jgi:hypothetical protein
MRGNKLNILVFPCGSEIGLEIHRSLKYSMHVHVIGGNSVDDHGKFVYEEYIGHLPFIDSEEIIPSLQKIVRDYEIDAIYPTMDKVIYKLKMHENEIGCKVISSPAKTTEICVSKQKTYQTIGHRIRVPNVYHDISSLENFPVFVKPDVGYGSRGVFLAKNREQLEFFLRDKQQDEYVILEYLPGEEYTVDCFTDRHGQLRFVGPRIRKRISNGISVNTIPVYEGREEFEKIAAELNQMLEFRGAWFFQVKRTDSGELAVMEIAARLGGSSGLYRAKGVNFALLSVFDAFDYDVKILENPYRIELDRALENKYKMDYSYQYVYVDFDDCLIVDGKVNTELIKFLYQAFNEGKKLILLTKHADDLQRNLNKYRLSSLFDEIIHIEKDHPKSQYISHKSSIFIDDSFAERQEVAQNAGIPVFAPDMIEVLLH